MQWLRVAGEVAVAALAVAALFRWLPPRADQQAAREAMRRQLADAEEARDARAQATKQSRIAATQEKLRVVGRAYKRRLAAAKTPPQENDFQELLTSWRSPRDDRPLVILWGVDLDKLPNAAGTLLEWEHSVDENTARCVLMADGTTTQILSQVEFDKLPRAK